MLCSFGDEKLYNLREQSSFDAAEREVHKLDSFQQDHLMVSWHIYICIKHMSLK